MKAILVLVLIICLIVGVIWMLRSNRTPAHRRRAALRRSNAAEATDNTPVVPGGLGKLKNNPMFWGVEMGQAGCEASHALLGRQYTFEESPQLPVEGCSSAVCTCQYKGLKDHRITHRRKTGERRVEIRFDKERPERRARKERRRGNDWKDRTH